MVGPNLFGMRTLRDYVLLQGREYKHIVYSLIKKGVVLIHLLATQYTS